MIEESTAFAVKRFCNYKIRIHSEIGNKIVLSIKEDEHFGELSIYHEEAIFTFDYFNGDSDTITITSQSLFHFRFELTQEDIEIKQFYMAEHLRPAFHERVKNSAGLRDYESDYLPALFFGVWSDEALTTLRRNKSLKIIIWSGGDINAADYREAEVNERIFRNVGEIRKLSKVIHIGTSPFIQKSLDGFGFAHLKTPVCVMNFDLYRPITKGDSIYIYTGVGGLESYYGFDMYDKVVEKYQDINFIFACCGASYEFIKSTNYQFKYELKYYEREELIKKVYPQCFLALRLTVHDGIANTVQELGLMGIKCVHNGNGPSSLNYKTFEDICRHIDNERKTIGTCDEELATEVRRHLTLDPNFFNTGFYRRNVHTGT